MKRTALFICALASIACHADELYIASNVMASSLDGLEFLLNGRPFFTGTVNKGSCSFSGPVSEWIKAGTNTLGVRVTERATEEMRASRKFPMRPDQARVRLNLGRRRDGKWVEDLPIIDEVFAILPTNFVFTVPGEWPIKRFVWEGETPTLTDKDKTEITGMLSELARGFASIDSRESQRRVWQLKLLMSEQEALLRSTTLEDYRKRSFDVFSKGGDLFKKEELSFAHADFIPFPGYNLVRVVSGGSAMKVAVFNDGSGYLKAPEWFSKIDGKWCIVP